MTHYYERGAGPFKNICDLSDEQIAAVRERDLAADIAVNRFKIWPNFIEWRRAACIQITRA